MDVPYRQPLEVSVMSVFRIPQFGLNQFEPWAIEWASRQYALYLENRIESLSTLGFSDMDLVYDSDGPIRDDDDDSWDYCWEFEQLTQQLPSWETDPYNNDEFLDEVFLDKIATEPMFVLDKDRSRKQQRRATGLVIKRRISFKHWIGQGWDDRLAQPGRFRTDAHQWWNDKDWSVKPYVRDHAKIDWETEIWNAQSDFPTPEPSSRQIHSEDDGLVPAQEFEQEVMPDLRKALVARRKEINANRKNREYPYRYQGHKLFLQQLREFKIRRQSPEMEVA